MVTFRQASALSLPFDPGSFDGAYMIHAGMNIADKEGVFREAARVLKPGGLFAIYDIMRTGPGEMLYPVPWGLDGDTSFVAEVDVYRAGLQAAGLHIRQERNRVAYAIEFVQRAIARVAEQGPPSLGLHLLVGDIARPMIANVLALMQQGVLAPVELIAEVG
jgi:ubiquinone/menaquinone biosynthesis C-methylase UbiE